MNMTKPLPILTRKGATPMTTQTLYRLRVLREFEPNMKPSQAGRMIISGHMIDVCAELNRMA